MHIRLIIPGTLPAVSGAAIYDRRIAAALCELGHTVDTHPGPGGVLLIDAAALSDFAADLSGAAALVHHPRSLETSPPDADLKAAEAAWFAAVRRIVVTSQQTADRLAADFGVPPEKIAVVTPGIDDLPRSLGSAGAACQILSVGQIVPRKGHDVLIRALARLFDLDWHLTVAGAATDPIHANGLRALAEDLNVARHVTFAGETDGGAMDALWQSADVFALTPFYEGYGKVFAEALRRGLPVLATAAGAAPDLIAPDCGAVCAPGDIDQVSKALRRLIFDKPLRTEIAGAAWQAGQALPSWREQATKLAAALA